MALILVAVGTPLFFLLALTTRNKLLFPIIPVLPLYYVFLVAIPQSLLLAFLLVLCWSLIQTAMVLIFSLYRPEFMKQLLWRSETYSQAMFEWIRTGELPEGRPRSVVLSHFKQTILYCVLALLSANFLSLVLGCALLNYMNYYVSQLISRSDRRIRALLLGWNPWSILRVFSFLWLGVLLSLPVIRQTLPPPELFLPALVGLAVDLLLKIHYGRRWAAKLKLLLLQY